jgi:hypothetical protein
MPIPYKQASSPFTNDPCIETNTQLVDRFAMWLLIISAESTLKLEGKS